MRRCLATSFLLSCLALMIGCCEDQSRVESKPVGPTSSYDVASPHREIVAQNVLAAQLATHNELEAGNEFATTEAIQASLYLTASPHIEPRRISAFLVRADEAVVEEQSISVDANDTRDEFDFSFAKTPRLPGAYQIRFVEIARSNGKPILLARLFLTVQ